MRALVAYATEHGSTRAIAETNGQDLSPCRPQVTVGEAAQGRHEWPGQGSEAS